MIFVKQICLLRSIKDNLMHLWIHSWRPESVSFKKRCINQFCGSRSGIRCLFDPWIRDPGWVKKSRWTSRIIFPRAKKQFFGLKILQFFDADPESFWPWIRDPGWTSRICNKDINFYLHRSISLFQGVSASSLGTTGTGPTPPCTCRPCARAWTAPWRRTAPPCGASRRSCWRGPPWGGSRCYSTSCSRTGPSCAPSASSSGRVADLH